MSEEIQPQEKSNEPVIDLAITMPRLIALATAKTPTIPDRYIGKPRDMVSAIWVGRELGLQPMEAINSLYLVNGQVSMSGKVMSALIHRAGHMIKVKLSTTEAEVECHRWFPQTQTMEHVGTVTFTEEDAKRAHLSKKDTYRMYPQVMLAWRAITLAARVYYADVISGVSYVPEEVGLEVDPEELPEDIIEGEIIQPLSSDAGNEGDIPSDE